MPRSQHVYKHDLQLFGLDEPASLHALPLLRLLLLGLLKQITVVILTGDRGIRDIQPCKFL